MCKKKFLFVTTLSLVDKCSKFESQMKQQYLVGNPTEYPSLVFFHQNAPHETIAHKVKEKKISTIVFDSLPQERVLCIKKALTRKVHKLPVMFQTGTQHSIAEVHCATDHEQIIAFSTN